MRAAVTRTERERALIVPERGIDLAGIAVGVTEGVLDIGIARVAQRRRRERRDGRNPLLGFDRLLAGGVVGIKCDGSRILFVVDRHGRKRGQQHSPANKHSRDVHPSHVEFR